MLLKLVASTLAARKVRTLLTALAIGLSVSLVVAMTSGFGAFEATAASFLDRYMGAIDANITRTTDPGLGLDEQLLRDLQDDARVRLAFPRLDTDAPLPHTLAGNPMSGSAKLIGVDRAIDPLLDWMKLNDGRWFEPGEKAAVIDAGMHEKSGLKVGDTFKISGPHGTLEAPIVGIVHRPGLFAGFLQAAYVPLEDAQRFVFGPVNNTRISQIRIQLKPETDLDKFASDWEQKLKQIDPLLKLKTTRASREQIDRNFMGLRLLSMLGGAVAMTAATFIIFSTLSMGVTERQRTLAMLRAIGATRTQIARLVIVEGTLLAVIGLLIGVPLGYGLAATVVVMLRELFEGLTPTLDWIGVLFASAAALGAALLASLLPAWQATRVDPLEAMTPLAGAKPDTFPWRITVAGLLLICIDPLLLFFPYDGPFDRDIRFWAHFAIGLPALMLGFFLLAPAFVWSVTRVFGPLLSAMLRVPYAVVQQQLSGGIWRSAGTCAALMVGLSVLVVMQTQGASSLNSWQLPSRFPDVFIFTKSFGGLSPAEQARIARSPFLKREDTMPIGAFAPEVGGGIMGLIGTRVPGNTMFVAVDPERAFRLMELEFRQGTPEEATRLLMQGKHVVVTEEFRKLRGLGVGDTLPLKSATKGMLEYKIAGVVWSPGIDVMINSFDMGSQFEQQSAASVFGSLDDARKDFGVENVWLMCANFRELGVPRETLTEQLQASVNDTGLRVADVRQLKAMIQSGLAHLLKVATSVAWGALAVASLGVANTIVASIRSRMWQFGVLRSIGLTRSTLLRIILVEGALLGLIGAAMGLACGAMMTVDARQMMMITLGHDPALTIPWGVIAIGVGVVVAVSVLAALIPAIRVSRTEPLSLLQAGRAAA